MILVASRAIFLLIVLLLCGVGVVVMVRHGPSIRKLMLVCAIAVIACPALLIILSIALPTLHRARENYTATVVSYEPAVSIPEPEWGPVVDYGRGGLAGSPPPAAIVRGEPRAAASSESDWSKADHWPASVYPTIESAGAAITTRLYEKLIECGQPEGAKVRLTMVEQAPRRGGEPQALPHLVPLQEWLTRREWRDVSIQTVADPGQAPPPDLPPPAGSIAVFVAHRTTTGGAGMFEANLHHPGLPVPQQFEARHTDKPWVRQEPAVSRQNRSLYVVGRSGLEPTDEDAMAAAVAEAVRRTSELFHERLHQRTVAPADLADLDRRIPEAARTFVNLHVADRFSQELQTDHVTVHRAAVRIAAAEADLVNADDGLLRQTRVARSGFFRQVGAGGVLGVFLLLAYLFLNAETKGHFAWKLRGICAGLFGALCWAIRHFGFFA